VVYVINLATIGHRSKPIELSEVLGWGTRRDVSDMAHVSCTPRFAWIFLLLVFLSSPITTSAPIELTLATHWGPGAQYDLLMRYLEEYNAMQSNVIISHLQSSGFSAAINEQFLVWAAAKAAPDIIHVPSSSLLQYGHQLGLLMPVPQALASELREKYIPSTLSLATVKGVLYGPPTENQMHALTLSGAVLDQVGVPALPPRTWDELVVTARKIRRVDADGKLTIAGIELIDARTIISMGWSNGAELLNATETAFTLDTPAWQETIEFLRRLVESELAVIGGSMFNRERAGIRLGAAPYMRKNYVRDSGQDSYARLVTAPLPPGRTGQPVAEHYGYALSVTASSKHSAEAWKFVRWLAVERLPEGTTRMGDVMAALGSIPVTYDDLRNQPTRKEQYLFGFSDILTKGYSRNMNDTPPLNVRNELAAQVLPALQGKESAQSALLKAQHSLQTRLNEYLAKIQ
jgi:multiple sugar transport system substrate-binding protein